MRQLLEPTVVRAADPERERLWHGAAELARGLFGRDSDPRSSEGDFAFLHGLYWLVSNLAEERPLLLCVDDVHWADAESLRFLNYLAPRLDGFRSPWSPARARVSARSPSSRGWRRPRRPGCCGRGR